VSIFGNSPCVTFVYVCGIKKKLTRSARQTLSRTMMTVRSLILFQLFRRRFESMVVLPFTVTLKTKRVFIVKDKKPMTDSGNTYRRLQK